MRFREALIHFDTTLPGRVVALQFTGTWGYVTRYFTYELKFTSSQELRELAPSRIGPATPEIPGSNPGRRTKTYILLSMFHVHVAD